MIVAESRHSRRLVGRLERGVDLLSGIAEVCASRGVRSGAFQAFGWIEDADLRELDEKSHALRPPRRFASPFTILHLQGSLAEEGGRVQPLATCALSRERDNGVEVIGGLLVRARVYSVDFVIDAFDDVVMRRATNATLGVPLLVEALSIAPPAQANPRVTAVDPAPAERSEPAARSELAAVRSEPSTPRSEPASARSEPVVARSESASPRSEPSVARSEPSVARSEPAVARSEPAVERSEASTSHREAPREANEPSRDQARDQAREASSGRRESPRTVAVLHGVGTGPAEPRWPDMPKADEPTAPASGRPDGVGELSPSWDEVARTSSTQPPAAAVVDDDPIEEPLRAGDVIDHSRFGRCEVERIEGDAEYAQVRLRNNRLIRLSLDVLHLAREGFDERGRRRFRGTVDV